MPQTTNTIVMIRPINFRKNEQTVVNNFFQQNTENRLSETISLKAQQEFDALVAKLQLENITVIVLNDTNEFDTPDAIFLNNWISFHENGTIGLYPMFAENRRLERREDLLIKLEESGFQINDVIDYTLAEEEAIFLEGTGSFVLDRTNRKAYCALSQRSDEELFIEFCEDFEYTPVVFSANQTVEDSLKPIYHTNVMLSIAETFAIICTESITDKKERKLVLSNLKQDGKAIISITEKQMQQFAGNMLQVKNNKDDLFLVMSESAKQCLTLTQLNTIKKYSDIISTNLETIETYGGGSARCMMAEVFLPKA